MNQPVLSRDVEARAREAGASFDDGQTSERRQTVLVLQGGGALGAYQVGVYQALAEGGVALDWVIGTSIGAINAAIIAGNRPADRLPRLEAFWERAKHSAWTQMAYNAPLWGQAWADMLVSATGVSGFFEPNWPGAFGLHPQAGAEGTGVYSTAPLERTLMELIDFDLLNDGPVRLTVGAANLRTAEMRYFDSRSERLTPKHIMASGALPPAFPAVRIGDELFWDGGVVSNTPVETVFDDNPRRSSLVFSVHLWNPDGPDPDTLTKVIAREKEVRYSSRAANHIARQKQLHRLRHVINDLARHLPEEVLNHPEVRRLTAYGCTTRMHVVRLCAPRLPWDTSTKDIDFSAEGVTARRRAGYLDTRSALDQAPWNGDFDPLEGFILHEIETGEVLKSS